MVAETFLLIFSYLQQTFLRRSFTCPMSAYCRSESLPSSKYIRSFANTNFPPRAFPTHFFRWPFGL